MSSADLSDQDRRRLGNLANWLHHNGRVHVSDETLDLLRHLASTQQPGVSIEGDPGPEHEPWTGQANIAWCPEHGLHGARDTCFECGEPVEQIPMVPLAEVQGAIAEFIDAPRRATGAQAEAEEKLRDTFATDSTQQQLEQSTTGKEDCEG